MALFHSSLGLGNIPLCVYVCVYTHTFLIHSSIDGHLCCFHVWAIVNSTSMDIRVHVTLWICIFSGYSPGLGLLARMATLCLVSWRTSVLFSIVVAPIYIAMNDVRGFFFFFPIPSPAFIICRLFDDGHSDWCEVILHCGFDLHFFNK